MRPGVEVRLLAEGDDPANIRKASLSVPTTKKEATISSAASQIVTLAPPIRNATMIRTQSRERAVLRGQQRRVEVRGARLAHGLRPERSGANYSWLRGAAWLIENKLLAR